MLRACEYPKKVKYAVPIVCLLLALVLVTTGTPSIITSMGRTGSHPWIAQWNKLGPYQGITEGWGTNAGGKWASPNDFQGAYLWVTYAAPWSHLAGIQAKVVRDMASKPGKVHFVTLLTSGKKIETAPVMQDAADWAANHQLRADRVVAMQEYMSMTTPSHVLFDGQGRVIYFREGWMTQEEMDEAVANYVS